MPLTTLRLLPSWSLETAPLLQIELSVIAYKCTVILSATHYCWVDRSICEGLFFKRLALAKWIFYIWQCQDENPWSSDHEDYAFANCATDRLTSQYATRTERVMSMTRERRELAISRLPVWYMTAMHHWVVWQWHQNKLRLPLAIIKFCQ